MRFNINLGVLGVCEVSHFPFYWQKHDLNIYYDGYTISGVRVHVVAEDINGGCSIIDNAIVISSKYLKNGGI